MRTWEKGTFIRVAVTVTDRFAVDATHEVSVLGSVVAAVGGSASLVAVSGRSHVLADIYGEYLGSGYSHKVVEYPVFELRLLKRFLQKVSSSVFGSLDPFSKAEFIVTRLKVQSIATGRCHVPVFVLPASPESCRCCRWLRSSTTSWGCGLSSGSTSRRPVERLTATFSGIIHSALLIHLQFSHLHLVVFF